MKKLQDLKMKLRSNKGFTLVEMIVVIAIIAILIALIAPNVAKLIGEATDTKEAAKAKSVYNGIQAWSTKLIKDDFAFQAADGTAVGETRMFVLAGDNAGDEALDLWVKDVSGNPATVDPLIGDGAYLPGNTLTSNQTIYAYFSVGGVLSAVVITSADLDDQVIGVAGSVDGLTLPAGVQFDNATMAKKVTTTDGINFNAVT